MIIEVYATRNDGLFDRLAVVGYPVTWSLAPIPGAHKVRLHVADGANVWEERGKVWIDEGENAGILRTFDGKPTLTISTYYGDVNKTLRIAGI